MFLQVLQVWLALKEKQIAFDTVLVTLEDTKLGFMFLQCFYVYPGLPGLGKETEAL